MVKRMRPSTIVAVMCALLVVVVSRDIQRRAIDTSDNSATSLDAAASQPGAGIVPGVDWQNAKVGSHVDVVSSSKDFLLSSPFSADSASDDVETYLCDVWQELLSPAATVTAKLVTFDDFLHYTGVTRERNGVVGMSESGGTNSNPDVWLAVVSDEELSIFDAASLNPAPLPEYEIVDGDRQFPFPGVYVAWMSDTGDWTSFSPLTEGESGQRTLHSFYGLIDMSDDN